MRNPTHAEIALQETQRWRAGRRGVVAIAATVLVLAGAAAAPAQNCTFTVSPLNLTAPPRGGGVTPAVSVATAPGCEWRVVSRVEWLPVTLGSTFTGPGPVALTAAANTTPATRTGQVTVAGQTVTVTQPTSCGTMITPSALNVPALPPAPLTITVTISSQCQWEAKSNDRWLTVSPTGTQSGNGVVRVAIEPNHTASRQGTLTVAGQTVTVNQVAGSPCTFSARPTSMPSPPGGGMLQTQVDTAPTCPWRAVSSVDWITFVASDRGTGPGMLPLQVAANPGGARSGTITVEGNTMTVQQSACSVSVAPTSVSIAAGGGPGQVTVSTTPGCLWRAVSQAPWLTITSGDSGAGPGTLSLQVTANSGAARTGTITVEGKTVTVQQAACLMTATPTTISMPSQGGVANVTLAGQAGCPWQAASTDTWMTFAPPSGAGPGTLRVTFAANTLPPPRTGHFTVGGTTVLVSQAAPPPCPVTVTPTSATIAGQGGEATFTVNSQCTWLAKSNQSWLTVTAPANGTATGNGTVTVRATVGSVGGPRSATLSIGNATVTVNQDKFSGRT
ncbi:MAG: BACON domain-containing protein [Thermoanaerobaculaceae bacterium]